MAAHLVEDVDFATYGPSWEDWPTPELPDLPIEPWADFPNVFWKLNISAAPVDAARTAQLASVNVPFGDSSAGGNPYQGAVGGFPFNLINHATPKILAWDRSRSPIRRFVLFVGFVTDYTPVDAYIPFSDLVRREGDPAGAYDQHVYLYNSEDEELWEMIQVDHISDAVAGLVTAGRTKWVIQYSGGGTYDHWDMKIPWDAPGQPLGTVAAGIPHLPLWARYEEIEAGHINHALFLALPNYATGFVEPARHGDGDIQGHPLRAGARLRLKTSVRNTFTAGTPERIFANALTEYGCIVGDRTMHNTGDYRGDTGGFAISMDPRWGPFNFHTFQLTDFEVIPPVAEWPVTPPVDPPPVDPPPDPPVDPPPPVTGLSPVQVTLPAITTTASVLLPSDVTTTAEVTIPSITTTVYVDLSTHLNPDLQ